jgi:3-hydroxybutyryl-CoA dehydratase
MSELTTNPRFLSINEIAVGQSWRESFRFDDAAVKSFADVSGDYAPHHLDEAVARRNGFDRKIVHGFLIGARFSRLLGMFLPGASTVLHSFSLDMLRPVPVGSDVDLSVIVLKIHDAIRSVRMELIARDEAGRLSIKGKATCVFRD